MTKHILIIDDEPTILRLLDFVLSKHYNVTLKSNGYEAMQLLESGFTPDLIILDIVMPYFNGVDFFQSIKVSGVFENIPVIVLTGADDNEGILTQMKFPVEKVMKKPFNPEKLKNAIENIFTTRNQAQSTIA